MSVGVGRTVRLAFRKVIAIFFVLQNAAVHFMQRLTHYFYFFFHFNVIVTRSTIIPGNKDFLETLEIRK